MSISKNYPDCTTILECDECGETFEADGLDFADALDEYKANGGTAVLVGGNWEHRCRDCR